MDENPWCRLPVSPPYVLPEDEQLVREFNDRVGPKRFLHLDIMPEPFVGTRDAPVVLLSNNPGFGKAADHKRDRGFVERMWKNLRHESSDYPFVYLDPGIGEVGKWWVSKLKRLLKRFEREVLARSILNVVYFPYPSKEFPEGSPSLESQKYGFHLVREALKRKAVIVFMRKGDGWLNEVAGLRGYNRRYEVVNWQNPAISENNCGGFEEVVQAIKAAEAKRQKP